MTKKPWEKLKYLENEKSFYDEIKKHFSSFSKCFQSRKYHKYHILKGLSITQIPQIFLKDFFLIQILRKVANDEEMLVFHW